MLLFQMLLNCPKALGIPPNYPPTESPEHFLSALGTVFVSLMETKCYFLGLPKASPLPAAFYAFKIHLLHFYVIVGLKERTLSTNHCPVGKNPFITLDAVFH